MFHSDAFIWVQYCIVGLNRVLDLNVGKSNPDLCVHSLLIKLRFLEQIKFCLVWADLIKSV